MKIFPKVRFLFNIYKKEIYVVLLFIAVALVALFYSLSLPFTVHSDTYVTLLANKVASDPTYPDRALLLHLNFKPFLYTNLLAFLVKFFSLFTYKMILVFFTVFTTSYGTYLALRLLKFQRGVSVLVALVALLPHVIVTGAKFGVFTADDVMGSTFGLPVMWLLTAWFIRRIHDKKPLWPVLCVAGLSTYIHPPSLLFLSGVMFLLVIYSYLVNKEYKKGLKDFSYSVLSFVLTSSALLWSIFFTTKNMGLPNSGNLTVTGKEYVSAVLYRIAFDFFPNNVAYAFQFLIMNLFFIAGVLYVFYLMRKRRIEKGEVMYSTAHYSFCIIFLSFFLPFTLSYLQLFLTRQFNFPLIFQQTSVFFEYYYLGMFFLWAIFVTFILDQYKDKKKTIAVLLLVIGMSSSALGFEWLQFLVGYYGYQREYIPNALQKPEDRYPDMTKIYPVWCNELRKVGVTRYDLVISDNFPIRYWCESRLFTTQEEGYIYVLLGRGQLVKWIKDYEEQQSVLYSGDSNKIIAFARKKGAKYVFLEAPSGKLIQDFKNKKILVSSPGDYFSVIKIY